MQTNCKICSIHIHVLLIIWHCCKSMWNALHSQSKASIIFFRSAVYRYKITNCDNCWEYNDMKNICYSNNYQLPFTWIMWTWIYNTIKYIFRIEMEIIIVMLWVKSHCALRNITNNWAWIRFSSIRLSFLNCDIITYFDFYNFEFWICN